MVSWRMAVPRSRASSGVRRGGISRRTRSWGPTLSTMRPWSKQRLETSGAMSPSSNPKGEAAAADGGVEGEGGGQGLEGGADARTLSLDVSAQRVVAPVGVEGRRRGDHRRIVAAEVPAVLARRPEIPLRLDQHHRERQPVPRERPRQHDHVRRDPRLLEAEEGAGPPAADLELVDNQEDVVLFAERVEAPQPLVARDVDAALGLDRLDDDRRRQVHAARVVVQVALEHPAVSTSGPW